VGSFEAGQRIRRAREAGDLSYRDLREVTGLALSHLQRLERGQVSEPSPHVLRKLSSAIEGLDYGALMRDFGYL